jgi:glycine C-acetyltransferase/8-amino-7-oxononanoate synthase
MNRSFDSHLTSRLAELESAGLLRKLPCPSNKETGSALVQFSSNDYLGLSLEPFLQEVATAAINRHGTGAGASRLLRGSHPPHAALEEAISGWKKTERALVFSSGYAAAVGTISALVGKGDVILMDKLCHASLIDGAKLSGALVRVFPHNNLERLRALLEWSARKHPKAKMLILTESVFSMDGDCPPLLEIVRLKQKYGAWLLLDEAHAVGVIGENGCGLAHELELNGQIEIQLGTLSKALGGCGGYVCGSKALISWLVNKARSFVYSTAPSPSSAAVSLAAIQWLFSEQARERINRLWQNIHLFSSLMRLRQKNESAIIPIRANSTSLASQWSVLLEAEGLFVPAIRYPTVAKGTERLRVTVSAIHTEAEIQRLATVLLTLIDSRPTHVC